MTLCNDKNEIIDSMNRFLLSNKFHPDDSNVNIYNQWSETSGIIIDEDSSMEFCLKYLCEMKSVDKDLLKENLAGGNK